MLLLFAVVGVDVADAITADDADAGADAADADTDADASVFLLDLAPKGVRKRVAASEQLPLQNIQGHLQQLLSESKVRICQKVHGVAVALLNLLKCVQFGPTCGCDFVSTLEAVAFTFFRSKSCWQKSTMRMSKPPPSGPATTSDPMPATDCPPPVD